MGVRVSNDNDFDLLVKDDHLDGILADLLAIGYELVGHACEIRRGDPWASRVPRLRYTLQKPIFCWKCINLWSESCYKLSTTSEMVEVPDLFAFNAVLAEYRWDPDPGDCAMAKSLSIWRIEERGCRLLYPVLARSAKAEYAIYVPSLPRLIDSFLDQLRVRQEAILEQVKDRQAYEKAYRSALTLQRGNLRNVIRHLYLEKPSQRQKLIPELTERNRAEMESLLDTHKRRPLLVVENGVVKEIPG